MAAQLKLFTGLAPPAACVAVEAVMGKGRVLAGPPESHVSGEDNL